MRNTFAIAGIFALATALSPTVASAQSGSGGAMAGQASGSASAQANAQIKADQIRADGGGRASFASADKVAGKHGMKGRSTARARGANKEGFCPPGQAKKPGSGSRYQC